MARSHGRILASIWNDRDFLTLDPAAQRLYMLLLSQPNLTHAGTTTLTLRRWARMSTETDEADVRYALELLEEARFVVLDWDTEELLIRTLIRNDGVFKQPKVMAAAVNEAKALTSPKIRHAIRDELGRLPLDEVTEKSRDDVAGMVKGLTDSLSTPGYTPRDTPPDTPSQAMQSNHATTQKPSTRTRAHSPTPAPTPAPAVSDGADFAATQSAQTILAGYIDACSKRPPDRFIGHLSREIKTLIEEGIDLNDIRSGLDILREKGLNPGSLASTVNQAMNAGRGSPGRSSNIDGHLALVQRLQAQQTAIGGTA